MKTTLLMTLVTLSLTSQVHAKSFFGTVDKYIINKTNEVIEIGSNEIEDDGKTASYYNYRESKRKTIDMSEVSKSTREEIAGVKAGETILVTTGVARSKTETISRFCAVFNVFENGKAQVGCRTYKEDYVPGYAIPNRMDFIINHVSLVTAEVESLDGFNKGETAELRINTENAKAGRNVRILAIFANGEALVQKVGFGILDTSSIVYKSGIDRIQLSDLNKLN